mgnify:CR=1 FL=1
MFDTLNRIDELRIARNWSVYKLAKLSNIPQSTIATWSKRNLCPPIDKLEILCNVFGITLSEFFSTENFTELTKEQSELLDKWDLLNRDEKQAVFQLITLLIKHK